MAEVEGDPNDGYLLLLYCYQALMEPVPQKYSRYIKENSSVLLEFYVLNQHKVVHYYEIGRFFSHEVLKGVVCIYIQPACVNSFIAIVASDILVPTSIMFIQLKFNILLYFFFFFFQLFDLNNQL